MRTAAFEPWFNAHPIEPDDTKLAGFFRMMFEKWKAPDIILNTGVEEMEESHSRIVAAIDDGRSSAWVHLKTRNYHHSGEQLACSYSSSSS